MAANKNQQVSLAKVAEYVEALTRDPGAQVFVPLSEIYRQAGMLDEAQTVALKGIKQNPDYGPGYVVLGRVLLAQGLNDKAGKAFQRALRIEPENLTALKGLLRIEWENGDADAARRTAEAVVALKPADRDAGKILQRLAPTGDKQGASEPAQKQAPSSGTAESQAGGEAEEPIKTATLADIYVRQGLFDKALNLYRQILATDPQNEAIKRKEQAVKKRLDEQATAAAAPAADAEGAGNGGAEKAVEPAAQQAPVDDAPDSTAMTIRTLEGWLDAIRQRREHVQ